MKNRKIILNVALWIVFAAATVYSSTGPLRWISIVLALVAIGIQVSSLRKPTETKVACCSFCGGSQADGRKLIHGPNVRICSSCVSLAQQVCASSDSEGRLPS